MADDRRAGRENEYLIPHTDGFGNIVGHHQGGNPLPPDNAVHVLGYLQTRLIIQRREGLIQQQDVRVNG